jgi:PIN domain nuclease of toxin-antitoxin system
MNELSEALVVEVFIMDTSGWIEFFRKSKVGEKIRELIIDGEIITPTVVLGELRKKYVDEGYEDEKFQEDYGIIRFLGETEHLSSDVAIKAGELRATCGVKDISLVDCIILTLAKLMEGKAISTDRHFKDQEYAIYFPVEA